jgi:preprotein translocase subunit SecA
MRELERLVFISILDNKWREHLYEMDYLREGIGLRGYGQRDPEMEYKREGYDMFQAMMAATKDEFARYMFHVQVVDEVQEQPSPTAATHDAAPTMIDAPVDAPAAAPNGGAPKPQPAPAPAKVTASVGGGPAPDSADFEKVGRNAPCPCGSGRKYKKCHGSEI